MLFFSLCSLMLVGRTSFFCCPCFSLATVYTIPETKPMNIAETDPKVTGASKKTRPDTAIGSLLSAPTIEYVVELVTRTHHAEVYEMKTADRPDTSIAVMTLDLVSTGKFFSTFVDDQSSRRREHARRTGIVSRLL